MNLNQLAEYLRANGIPSAEVATTGGNCHSVVIPLPDGGDVLVGDHEGPLASGDDEVDGLIVIRYSDEACPFDEATGGDGVLFASEVVGENCDVWADAGRAAEVVRGVLAEQPVTVRVDVTLPASDFAMGWGGDVAELRGSIAATLGEVIGDDGGAYQPTLDFPAA